MIEDITFRNITVLHNFHKPVISIHNSDHALVRHVVYDTIIVEDAQMGEGDGDPYLIDFTTTASQWSTTLRRGSIRDVTVSHVCVLSGKKPGIRIYASGTDSTIDDIRITALTILGEPIHDFSQVDYLASPYNGDNIVME